MRVVVSLTTIPGRSDLLARAIASLRRQTRPPDAIHLWLPEEHFGADGTAYRFAGVDVRSGPDLGPAMKSLPLLAIETDPETLIVPVDDDIEYPPDLIEKLVGTSALLPEHAIGFTGWALEWGASDGSFRSPMAIVVIGGLITSTLLSLLVIPVLYTLVDDGVS